ncbi:hypothetical protein AJ79_07733 [Helicocarpus griseus UAMH5409]|uniref:Amidohydrolase-related domain-containing protein n=1 Tax=Helicocarpus griseus UAMH5409 TaxID=1447875 RepID=A0A2B7WZ59_9EURO|nr:hypothetical protein AJ79_07733 [Helicocarpus griseus UAMH5409]
MPIPIIDSHIHLFAASHLDSLAWRTPGGPLDSQHSVAEYRLASASVLTDPSTTDRFYLRGFIFLETDRISSLEPENWSHALDEVAFLSRIARGEPIEGEGHQPADRSLCVAIIPWAPVLAGPSALQAYLSKVRERTATDEVWRKIRGVRYLLQDKPAGTMLKDQFIEGLRYLGRQGMTFDLGIDARQGGLWQLDEAVKMLEKVYEKDVEADETVKVVINHLCKPNLHIYHDSVLLDHPDFLAWKGHITSLSRFPRTYMKLSGAFSELHPDFKFPASTSDSPPNEEQLLSLVATRLQPWTDVVFDTFGANRVMFGSDWPVCNVRGGGNQETWLRWTKVVENLLDRRKLDEAARNAIWAGTAAKVYGIKPS